MPILGVIASSTRQGQGPTDTGAMVPIGMVQVGAGGASSITFSSIPSTYSHLQVRLYGKTQRTSYSISELKMTFNGDTGNNYAGHYLVAYGNASTLTSASLVSGPRFQIIGFGANSPSQVGSAVVDVLDYASTSKYKTARILSGVMTDTAGAGGYYGNIGLCSGLWQSTSAVTSINIAPEDAVNFAPFTNIALYGIKGA